MGVCASKPARVDGGELSKAQDLSDVIESASPAAEASIQKLTARSSPISPLELAACYKPDTEPARLQALLDCKCLDTVSERRFDAITGLLKEMFNVPMALVSLIDDDQLVFKSVAGTDCRRGNRLHSFCDASLRAPNPTMMVVPDTLEDVRFQNSQFVKADPYIRFYSGAPLVSSEGLVMGSLGIMDIKPRCFPAGALNMICNFAELVVREMERDKAREQAELIKVETALSARRHMVRALSCFQEAVMLCNVAAEGWPILYVNDNWCSTTGFSEPACLNSTFWDLFHPPPGAPNFRSEARQAAGARAPFTITVAGGNCSSATLELRPATADHLSSAIPTIAIPNFVEGMEPAEQKVLDGYYFAVVKQVGELATVRPSASSTPSVPSTGSGPQADKRAPPVRLSLDSGSSGGNPLNSLVHSDMRSVFSYTRSPFGLEPPATLKGLKLGPLLGKGGYGKVYRGVWKSAPVAVKIMESWVDTESSQPTQPMLEALFSKTLTHPCIVQCFDFAFQVFEPESGDEQGSGTASSSMRPGCKQQQVWIVQQYCNHGTLGDAVDRGWLRAQRSADGPPNLWAVLPTAQEIAAALQYLHSQGVIHGDLTPGNVLLTGARHTRKRDPRSFQAKVGDFGLSRLVSDAAQQAPSTTGTVTHMPPELIEQELLTPAVDAYSFGVLCWEMLSGRRAWAGLSPIQVLTARTTRRERLEVPAGCPRALRELVEACLSEDHTQRPSFDAIVEALDALLEEAECRAQAAAAV